MDLHTFSCESGSSPLPYGRGSDRSNPTRNCNVGGTLIHVHIQLIDEKRPSIRGLFDPHGRRLSGAVSCAGLNADQRGVGAGLGGLQRRREFEAVKGYDAVVVIAGGDHRGGIGRAGLQIVNG